MEEQYLDIQQLMQLTRWSKGTIYNRLSQENSMPSHIKMGRKLLFPIEDVRTWLRAKKKRSSNKNSIRDIKEIDRFILNIGGTKK